MGAVPPVDVRLKIHPRSEAWCALCALQLDLDRAHWETLHGSAYKLETAILAPECRDDVVRALQGMKLTQLQVLAQAMQLKTTSCAKAKVVNRIADQCCRGVARGVTLRGDVPAAIFELTQPYLLPHVTFSTFWIHVHAGREEEFLANPCAVARDVWRHTLALSHDSPRSYFSTQGALCIAMYKLYGQSKVEMSNISDEDRAWLTWMVQYGDPSLPFVGEQCWDSRTECNRALLMHLKPPNMAQVFDARKAYLELPNVSRTYVGPNKEKVDYKHAEIQQARYMLDRKRAKANADMAASASVPTRVCAPDDPALARPSTVAVPRSVEAASRSTVAGPRVLNTYAVPQSSVLKSIPAKWSVDRSTNEAPADMALAGLDKDTMAFYARLQKAEPMYEMISQRQNPTYVPGDLLPPQKVLPLKTFQTCFFLDAASMRFLQNDEFELQVVCMLQNDDVKERIQWPLDVYLTVNDSNLQVPRRSTIKSVTKSTRDPAVRVPVSRLRAGSNHVRMFHRDKRGNFLVAVRIARKRTLDEVSANIPKASSEAVALKNALKHLGFTKTDDDDIIMEDSTLFSLRCPISGQVFSMPARLSSCQGMHAFDATSFLQLNVVSRKWCCPECGKKGGPSDLRVDSFIKRCVDTISERGLDKVSRIEIDKEGRWRPREEAGATSLAPDQLRWYASTINGSEVTWVLQKADEMSPTSTATKIAGDDTETPNVQSKQIKASNGGGDSDDSELDEEEEYKRAIREAAQFSGGAPTQPRKSMAKEPDVIVISDDDDEAPALTRPRPTNSLAQGSASKRPKPSSALQRVQFNNPAASSSPRSWLHDAGRPGM